MAIGTVENLTGEISYSREHELTAYDDILTITSATVNLLKPAGDLMLMQGNDTVTITESTIIGDTGVGLLLGSGDDTLTIQNSEIKSRISLASGNDHVIISGSAQSVVTLTALDPDQTSIETEEDLTTLSMGDGDDVLELCAILQGNGVINFGSGSDTLIFNAGTLNNTGGIANMNNLTVTNLGGTTYRDLELVDAGNRIEWNGNLRGNDNVKWIVLDAVSGTALAEAAFITDNNVVSNIGFKITNRTFVQTDGGTWEISGRSGNTAFMADDSKVTLYHMVLTENKTGFSGNNTDWNLNKSNISNHSERGAVITGGSLTFNDLGFSQNSYHKSVLNNKIEANGGGAYASDILVSGSRGFFSNNDILASASASIYAKANGYTTKSLVRTSASAYAQGGGLFTNNSTVTLTDVQFSGNLASASTKAFAKASSSEYNANYWIYAMATASASAYAQGGGLFTDNSTVTLTDVQLTGNIVSAYASATASAETHIAFTTAEARSYASAYAHGGGLFTDNSTITLTGVQFSANLASASVSTTLDVYPNTPGSFASAYTTIYAEAKGGGIYASGGILNADTVIFSDNHAIADEAQGGAIYADNAVVNLTNSIFTGNKAKKGGALYGANNSKFTYTLSRNSTNLLEKITISGNMADEGGFLYLENSTADFIIGSNIKLLLADSIAGNSGVITKSGADMEISAAISDDSIRWNVASGLLELSCISRTINLNNWTIGANAILRLSSLDDTVNMSTDKKIGTLDLGGGSDVINTGGYSLSEGKLLVSKLTFTGGGRVSSTISTRTADASFDITLANVVLDSTIIGGRGNDIITVTQKSTVGGPMDLGDGNNVIRATADVTFASRLVLGKGNDILEFTNAVFNSTLALGDGDNTVNVNSSLVCHDSISAGDGNDTISLTGSNNASTFSGMVDLGLGDNKLYIEGNVTGNIDFMLHKGGTTTAVVYRGASITGKTVSVYSRPNAELKALTLDWSDFSGDEALDKVRILISSDATFSSYEYSIELYNRVTDFTINVEEGYFYQLQANDEDGWAQRYLDDTIAPDQVGGLTWSGDQARWDVTHDNWGGNGVKQYHVELSSDAEFNNVVESATVTTTEYAFTGITEGNYYWRVRAEDFTGNLGDWSETASVFVDLTAPTAPRGLTSTSGDYSVTLSWSAASDSGSGVALYEYRIATDSGFASITVSGESSSISDVTVNDLVYGTYYWQVRAIDNSGNVGQWSLYKTFSIADTIAPTAPGQLDYQLDGNSITLDWLASSDDTDGSGLKEYRIEFSNQSDFSQIIFSRTSTSTRITVDELSGGNYFCRVSAVDQSGNVSAWSNIQNFQIEGSVQSQTPSRSDINGNGVSDVLFQYTGGDYQLGFWLDGTNNWQGQGIPESADWDVIGAYDMSSDGQADVVMLGNVTVSGIRGAFVGYRKNGDMSSWENISYLTNAEGVDWQVKVGNLTGNEGKNSILWHAPDLGAVGVWTDGTDNWVSLGAGYDRNWEMIGAGDFDGDGADSILFSYANGAKYYALDLDQTATELGVSDSGWEVRAIGDFSGDGKDDIVAFNAATGLVAKWENGNSDSWSSLGQLDAADWFIAGTGDYNGDGTDDLLVRQYSTGMLGYYADADLSKWNEMGRGVDMNWAVIA